jgi:quercetin 2,3-dioxygenase
MASRTVEKIVIAREQSEGVGARVRRSVGNGVTVDPFLMLDEFNVGKPAGFPDHPHRGMQTVTYMLEGSFRHEDNKGHAGTIGPGDLQWMNAGRGIVHSEMPGPDRVNRGLQLWVNLAKENKMSPPEYQELLAADIPSASNPDGKVTAKVVAGECFGVKSPVFTRTPTIFLDVTAKPGGALIDLPIPSEFNAFIYVIEGQLTVAKHEEAGTHGSCIVLTDGDSVSAVAGSDGARFVLIGGKPLNEPIAQSGPFVMNTREELMQAYRDYQDGKF